ncbi:hypothetical protein [Mycoplasma suis]|uniref:Uncharacterized protein n=1 Tax=Mycoplasma suis (strain KI_3806) TaxID=708248 RepID=F0V348_MYCS3|nr:hypothetical protein [Mycoplasma suis]CBZ40270.1 hypothetical protein MSUIS_01770 [Mycoplasma suis KI3806]
MRITFNKYALIPLFFGASSFPFFLSKEGSTFNFFSLNPFAGGGT